MLPAVDHAAAGTISGSSSASDGPLAEELLGSDDGERSYHGSRGERDQEPADSADCEEDEDAAVRGR